MPLLSISLLKNPGAYNTYRLALVRQVHYGRSLGKELEGFPTSYSIDYIETSSKGPQKRTCRKPIKFLVLRENISYGIDNTPWDQNQGPGNPNMGPKLVGTRENPLDDIKQFIEPPIDGDQT